MTDEELIAGLRANALWVTTHDAADRIEALVKERNIAQHQARMRKAFIEEARDERDRAEARTEHWENVAIARDAKLRKAEAERDAANALLREARSGLCAYTGGASGACEMTILRIDAHLGAKP